MLSCNFDTFCKCIQAEEDFCSAKMIKKWQFLGRILMLQWDELNLQSILIHRNVLQPCVN